MHAYMRASRDSRLHLDLGHCQHPYLPVGCRAVSNHQHLIVRPADCQPHQITTGLSPAQLTCHEALSKHCTEVPATHVPPALPSAMLHTVSYSAWLCPPCSCHQFRQPGCGVAHQRVSAVSSAAHSVCLHGLPSPSHLPQRTCQRARAPDAGCPAAPGRPA